MGKRGPKPTPTDLKLLRGEARPSRVNRDEPQPLPAFPDPPEHLGDEAKVVAVIDFDRARARPEVFPRVELIEL